jgi:hypothetical protein
MLIENCYCKWHRVPWRGFSCPQVCEFLVLVMSPRLYWASSVNRMSGRICSHWQNHTRQTWALGKCVAFWWTHGWKRSCFTVLWTCLCAIPFVVDGVDGRRHAPAALSHWNRSGSHRTVGWVGPRADLDGCGNSRSHRDPIPGLSNP